MYSIRDIQNSELDLYDTQAKIYQDEVEIGTVRDYGDSQDLEIKFYDHEVAAQFQDVATAHGQTIQGYVLTLIEIAIDEE
ncbi:hypothetical protein [Paraburkholderia fungorum]|jgi:hypothetical protein|uniref:hypothetical protein n=1 Tax=Paraburkholderia fungorum TaxID=134537 RepID=UPI000D06AEBE|nr:hypothetical protein [Paraburkholderia fungorum]PRZ45398.1 hypothetical protein BX589_13977 [Paraburkholderia fungorum]